jgi:putative ABC transport system ATP-binding protein
MTVETAPEQERIGTGAGGSAWATIRLGLSLTPELRKGLVGTLALAVVATIGKIIVPIAVQQTIDTGIGDGAPDMPYITRAVVLCAAAVILTALAS